MKRDLQGKRILITGASRGIGRYLAKQLAPCGTRLALVARSIDKLDALARELPEEQQEAMVVIPADVTSENDRQRLIQTVTDRLGGLDVLINNAGIASFAHFTDSSEAILRQVMEVNFFAPAELIRLAIPLLRRGQQPAIVNISSMCGRRGLPAWSEYSASKFALCGLTEALRGEMARFDIDVLLVVPGLTRTDLPRHLLQNTGRMKIDFGEGMPPEVVAQQIARSLQKNRTETVLGREATWMLRFNRFFPRWMDRLIARRVCKLYS
jgi:short-subunit dehydrogenase